MTINELPWDSSTFGYKVGIIKVKNPEEDKLIHLLNRQSGVYKLVYIESDTILNNELFGYNYSSVLYEKNKVLPKINDNDYEIRIEEYESKSEVELLNLTFQSGQFSRFKIDDKFSNGEFISLYSSWIKNSIEKKIADKTLVAFSKERKIAGFCTMKLHEEYSKIGLISVDSNFRGFGIGTKLINEVAQISQNNNISKVLVNTQLGNISACKFYEKNGFNRSIVKNIYHWWNT